MDVVILAGGRCDPATTARTGIEHRWELPFQDGTLLDVAVAAVQHVGHLIVVGGPESSRWTRVEAGDRFIDSVTNGLEQVSSPEFLLVTSDLPFLTAESVDAFLGDVDPNVLLNYPIIPIAQAKKQFPGMARTTLKLREGEFTGGNIAVINTALMHRAMPLIQDAYEHRKSVFKLARLVGFSTLVKILAGKLAPKTLTIASLERAVSRLLGGPVRAVTAKFAEIGADIDNEEQYLAILR